MILFFNFAFIGFLTYASVAIAVPTITDVLVYTQNFGPDADVIPGFAQGHFFGIDVLVSDPLGVPGNIAEAKAIALTQGQPSYNLYYVRDDNYHAQGQYTEQKGRWEVNIKNLQDETDNEISHDLDKPRLIPLPKNIQFSNNSTTPTITWDRVYFDNDLNPITPDIEVDYYALRLVTPAGNQYFRSNSLLNPTFTIPDGVLLPGENIFVRILASDADREGGIVFLENRSNLFTAFTPSSIPEPLSILLLSSGLVCLAGLRRKFKK